MVDEGPSRAAEVTQGVARTDPLPRPKFTDEAMALICRDIGAPLDDPEHRDRLRAALEAAAVLYLMGEQNPPTRGAQVAREARQIAKAASALLERVERMSERTKVLGISASGYFAEKHGAEWFNRMVFDPKPEESGERGIDLVSYRAATQFLSDLRGVRRLEAVFAALARTPTDDRGGRARNHARANYVSMLARIYEETTGDDPHGDFTYERDTNTYGGPFFSFVKRNLDIVRRDHGIENLPLGNLIRSVLPKRPGKSRPRRVRAIG